MKTSSRGGGTCGCYGSVSGRATAQDCARRRSTSRVDEHLVRAEDKIVQEAVEPSSRTIAPHRRCAVGTAHGSGGLPRDADPGPFGARKDIGSWQALRQMRNE